jgi:three-Cys-motif partner protein
MNEEFDKLRLNSRIKHLILSDYLPTWASILGKWNDRLNYIDCYAGPGKYSWEAELVDGSPIIAIKQSAALLSSPLTSKPRQINLLFIENNPNQIKRLSTEIGNINNPQGLSVAIRKYNSEVLVEKLLSNTTDLAPTFFFIDPYEHPFSLGLMNKIMNLHKTEILVNFMYYQIIRDIDNPMKKERCSKLFAPDNPKNLNLKTLGKFDEDKMLTYLHKRIGAKYFIPFKVYFGPDEKVASGKLKYLLIHYSNNYKAFDLMLNIMWKHSEQNKPLMVTDRKPILFPIRDIADLEAKITSTYNTGKQVSFDQIVEDNWQWYFRESHFRAILKQLQARRSIEVRPVTSKTERGLRGKDLITFL